MRNLDAVRGKEPTKTELILDYLLRHPKKVFTPKEVSEGLGFNLQTTVTVLNRLVLEGAISKRGRGQFCYDKEGEEKSHATSRKPEISHKGKKATLPKIPKKTAKKIYNGIYDLASESIGISVIGSITELDKGGFDEKAPIASLRRLVVGLMDLLGEEMVNDFLTIALEGEFTKEQALEFINLLKA